jgi:hypothetical protein
MKNFSEAAEPSRRHFIQKAGTGILGALLIPVTSFQESENKVRIGIIGGRFGAEFQFHQHPPK